MGGSAICSSQRNLNSTRANWLTVMVSMALGTGILESVYRVYTR